MNVTELTFDGFGYRLIPSRFPSVEVYQGLVANDHFQALYDLEAETNPRLKSKDRALAAYAREGSARLQNWNHAPFRYANPEGTRFFPSTRPALEMAGDPQTALARAILRREVFLERTREASMGIDMRMLKTPVNGRFADLTQIPLELDEVARRAATADIPDSCAGVAFLPPERPHALCLAVLDPAVLGTSIQTVHYRFEWNGKRISKVYEFTEAGWEWDPAELSGIDQVIAA